MGDICVSYFIDGMFNVVKNHESVLIEITADDIMLN